MSYLRDDQFDVDTSLECVSSSALPCKSIYVIALLMYLNVSKRECLNFYVYIHTWIPKCECEKMGMYVFKYVNVNICMYIVIE